MKCEKSEFQVFPDNFQLKFSRIESRSRFYDLQCSSTCTASGAGEKCMKGNVEKIQNVHHQLKTNFCASVVRLRFFFKVLQHHLASSLLLCVHGHIKTRKLSMRKKTETLLSSFKNTTLKQKRESEELVFLAQQWWQQLTAWFCSHLVKTITQKNTFFQKLYSFRIQKATQLGLTF